MLGCKVWFGFSVKISVRVKFFDGLHLKDSDSEAVWGWCNYKDQYEKLWDLICSVGE